MTIDTDITGKFSLDRLDHEELSDILSAEFGGCMQFSMTELVYPPNKHEYALKATYDKEGNIKTLSSGPLLTERRLDEIVSRIDSELVKGNEEKIASVTLFSNVPVDGYFRYRDKWQVLPPDEAASKPGFLVAWHPFTLECHYRGNTNFSIDFRRRLKATNRAELTLVALLPWIFGGYGTYAHHEWVWIHNDTVSTPRFEHKYLQVGYSAPTDGVRSDFTDIGALNPMRVMNAQAYYAPRGISFEATLDLPSNLELLLDCVENLDRDQRARFLRAGFWFRHARRVHHLSRSAVFTSLISALESLIEDEKDVPNCDKCGRPLGKGRNKLFQDLVNRFAPDPSAAADRKKLYALRSRLSHGGALLGSDLEAWNPNLHPDRIDEWTKSDNAWQLTKIVVVNWVLEFGQRRQHPVVPSDIA